MDLAEYATRISAGSVLTLIGAYPLIHNNDPTLIGVAAGAWGVYLLGKGIKDAAVSIKKARRCYTAFN